MIEPLPPAAILIVGALLVPLFKGRLKSVYLLVVPALALLDLLYMPAGKYWTVAFLEYDLIFGRADKLSMAFGYVFVLITFIGMLYALNVRDDAQHMASLIYAGGALGVTFAGDLFSLYVFWEILAIASVFLILARRKPASTAAAFRYFMWHFFGGLCLLAGIILYVIQRGTAEFAYIGLTDWASLSSSSGSASMPPYFHCTAGCPMPIPGPRSAVRCL
jgi:multicomponent Na+:H+ antiporter subunit D